MIDAHFTGGNKRVLDIGGGPGRFMIELLKRGCQVTLFDLSPENVALAKIKAADLGLQPEQCLVEMPTMCRR